MITKSKKLWIGTAFILFSVTACSSKIDNERTDLGNAANDTSVTANDSLKANSAAKNSSSSLSESDATNLISALQQQTNLPTSALQAIFNSLVSGNALDTGAFNMGNFNISSLLTSFLALQSASGQSAGNLNIPSLLSNNGTDIQTLVQNALSSANLSTLSQSQIANIQSVMSQAESLTQSQFSQLASQIPNFSSLLQSASSSSSSQNGGGLQKLITQIENLVQTAANSSPTPTPSPSH